MGLISSIKKVVSKITGQDNNNSGSSNTTTHTEIKYSTPPWSAPKSQPSTPVKQDSSTLKQGNGPVNTINEAAKQAVTLPKNTSTSGSSKSGSAASSGNTDKWSRMSESQQQEQKAVSEQEHAQYEAKQQNQETKTERSARFHSSSPGSFGATEPGSRFESFKRFPTLSEVKKREEEKNPQPQPGAAPQVPEPSVPPVVPDLNRYPGNTTVISSGKGVLSEAVTKAGKDPFNTELSAYAVARDPQILYKNDNWDFYNDFKNNQAKNKTFNYFGAQMDAQKHTTPGIFGKGTQLEEGYVPDNPHFYGYNYEPQTHEANEYKEEAKPYIAAGLIVPGLFNSDEPRIVKREYSRSAHGGVMYDTVIYTDEKGKKIELIRGSAHEDEYNTRFLSSFMTESEQSAYYYLRGRYGEDRSDEYIKQLSKALETRALDADTAERYYDIGKNDPIVARITSLLGGYAKIADFVQAGYKDLTNQTPEHNDYNATTALNALEAGENEGHGAIYRFINGAVNGALENLGFAPLEAIPVVGHAAATGANFMAASGEKYGQMISDGTFNENGSTANMITYGIINAVEYGLLGKAFSTPLSQLAKIGPQTAVKSTIVNSANLILSNLGIGATQSFLSSIADTALMGDNSTYNQLIKKYKAEGKTDAEAKEQAVKDIASGIGQAALAAGLIGTVFGIKNVANEGISFIARGAALERSGKTIYDVLNDANASGANSAARKNAAKIRAGLDNSSITPDMYREVMGAQDILNQIDIARQDTYRQRMQELTGLKIGEGQVDERANGAYRDGVVAVSPTAQIPREEVITHEGQHAVGTKEYHDAVQSIEGFQNAVERVINNYKDQGMTISRKVAEDEVASIAAQNFTQNIKDVERLIRYAEGNPKVADKIYNGLRDLRARVYAKGGRVVYDEKTGLKMGYDELRNLEKLWENAITTVRERGYNKTNGDMRNAVRQKTVYDYRKPFDEQIDDWKQGKIPPQDSLVVGATPDVLKNIGFTPLPMTINQTHVDYAINGTKDIDHFIGESLIKQLPDKIKEPVAVIESQTQPNTSVIALLDFQHNGKTIIAPVEIDGYGRQNNIIIDSNAITSIFGKGNAVTKQLNDAITEHLNGGIGVYYIDTKKAAALLQKAGLQLPGVLFRNSGYINSITDPNSKVKPRLRNNTYSQQFKRWFGDWEKSPNTASKVVNADGTPKAVYHQTANDFTVFDTQSRGAGKTDEILPSGSFFKSSDRDIGLEGKKQVQVYLDIKKPLHFTDRSDAEAYWRKNIPGYGKVLDELKLIDTEYEAKLIEAESRVDEDYMQLWDDYNSGKITEEEYQNRLEADAEDDILAEWEKKSDKVRLKAKNLINNYMAKTDYDGIILRKDEGSFGRTTDAYIVFNPTQIKSATDNIGTFDSDTPDIRYSAKKISDTSKWGTNIDRDVTEFTSGLGMNKTIWKRAGKTDVKELIRDAYRLYDENNNTEAQAKLRDAGSMIADSIKLKRGQIIDVNSRTNIINNFVAEFEKNYQQGKTNLIMREARPQDTSDRQNYGIGVNKYVRDAMRSIGVEPNQINKAEEKAVREAFEHLKAGDEESARNALDTVARDIYSRARAELLPNERAFMDAVRDSSLDLSSYTDTGELADGDLERLRQITGGSKNRRSTVRSAPNQAYKELSSLFPEFLLPDAGGDPARNILDAYNRIEEKISEPRYGLNDIIAGAENFKDKVITDYHYAQPAAKNTAVEQKNYDTEKYGSDIEASFRDIMSDVTEGEVKRSSQIVRKTLDGIIDGDEIWDDPLSAYDELARNIDETVQQITRGRNRSTDEKQRLAIQIMQSVCDNADSTLALAKERTRDEQIKAAIEGNQERFNQYRERFEKLYKNGNNVHEATSRIYSNTGQKSWLTPETKAEMERNIHSFKYNRQTNMDSYNQAKERLENSHPDDLFNELATTPEWSAVDTMTTQLVVTYYQSTGNVTKAVQLMEIARDKATRAGQMNQAWAFVNRLTPAGKLKAWECERTRNIESQIRKKYPGQADALIEEYHDAIEKQEAAQQRLREELYDNNEDYRKTKDEITSKETDVLGRQRSLSEAQNAYNEVQSERVEIEQRVSETQRIIDYGKATADASKKLIEATDELQLLQQQMKDIQMSRRKYKATQERIHSLQEQIDGCKTDLTELDEKIGNAETRIEKLNKTAESRRFERDEIQKRLEAANKEVAELEKQQTELDKQLKALQHGEAEAAERALIADSNLEKLKKEIRKLQNNLSHIEKMHRDGASEQDMIDYLDDFFDRLGIDHIGEADLSDYRDAFLMIEEMNTPESLADIILRQSEQRHTARGPVTKKILEGMIKDTSEENIELMKSIATQQLFGMIADTEKASVGRVMSTVLAINQLMNPRTAIRNVLSNMAFSGVEGLITHNVAALLDWGIVQHITGERSISFENPFKGYKTAVNRAKMAYLEQGLNVDIIDRNPTAVSPTKKRTFKRGPGSALEHALGYELTVTDEFAKGVAEGRLRDGLTKIGYTEDEANEIIKEEVLYRTFQDETLPARALQRAKEALNVFGIGDINEQGVHDFGLGNLITNYTIVPGNIFMRSIEYSPVGALKIVQDIYQIGRGLYGRSKIDSPEAKAQSRRVFVRENQRKLLLDITRPLTGGALIWAGYMLKKHGVIVNAHSDEDDYNLNKYDTAKGLGDMQINASALMRMFKKINPDGADTIESAFDGTEPQQGDKLVDLGWMQPVNTGLAIGARIAEATGGTGYHLFSGDGFEQLMTATAGSAYESVQDLAMWSGINNIVTNLKYTDGAGEFVFAESADLALSFLPSVLNQAGNIIDTETRYPYKADGVFELAKWKLYSKLPYMPLREKVPERINLWGEKQSSTLGSTWLDALNSMVFPGSVSKYEKNPMTDELDRLAALDSSVLPKTPYNNNNVTVDGQSYSFSLKGHEYEDFAQMLGQETYKNMILFMNSEDYKLLSDTQRTEELSTISTETNKAVQTAYAMLQLGKSESDIQETLDEHKEEYRQAAANYVLVRQAIDYIQSPGVNVEDAGVSAYTLRSYTEEETKEAIEKNNSYIAKVKAGTYYRYDTGSDGKQHKVYACDWTAEERQKKIDEFTADNEKLANGSKTKKEYITGQWADLTAEQREQLLKNIAKYPDEITLPDSVKANKPDMSGEGYEDNTSVPAKLPSPTGPFYRSLTELFGNPDFSIDDPDTYNIDGGKAAQPKTGGMLSGTDAQTLTAYGGSGTSSKWSYNNYNKSGRKYYYKSSKSYSRSYSRNYSRSYAKNNSSRTFSSRSRSGNGTSRTYTASAASGRFSSRNGENRFGRYNSGSGTRRFSSRFRNTAQA